MLLPAQYDGKVKIYLPLDAALLAIKSKAVARICFVVLSDCDIGAACRCQIIAASRSVCGNLVRFVAISRSFLYSTIPISFPLVIHIPLRPRHSIRLGLVYTNLGLVCENLGLVCTN